MRTKPRAVSTFFIIEWFRALSFDVWYFNLEIRDFARFGLVPFDRVAVDCDGLGFFFFFFDY